MAVSTAEFAHRGLVRGQPVGDDFIRDEPLVLKQFLQQFEGCSLVPPRLLEDIQNLAFLVDGPPHEHPLAVNADDHLVELPHAVCGPAPPPDVDCDHRAELVGPAAHGLVGGIDAALGEQILDVAQARGEAEIQPHRQPNRIGWEPVALVKKWIACSSPGGGKLGFA
jgi:hypothetical protein